RRVERRLRIPFAVPRVGGRNTHLPSWHVRPPRAGSVARGSRCTPRRRGYRRRSGASPPRSSRSGLVQAGHTQRRPTPPPIAECGEHRPRALAAATARLLARAPQLALFAPGNIISLAFIIPLSISTRDIAGVVSPVRRCAERARFLEPAPPRRRGYRERTAVA